MSTPELDPHNTRTASLLTAAETRRADEARDATRTDADGESVWESERGSSAGARHSRSEPVAVHAHIPVKEVNAVDILVTVAVILTMIALGAFVIHLLNSQHAERIATFHYSGLLPGRRGRNTATPQPTHGRTGPPVGPGARCDGGRGRLRPRQAGPLPPE